MDYEMNIKTSGFLKARIDRSNWKRIRLGDFEQHRNNTCSRSLMTDQGGRIHNIHYGDILIKFNEIVSLENTKIECLTAEGEAHAPKDYVQDGDIIIADTAEDEMVGKMVEVQEIGKRRVLSGLHTVFYRPPANIFVRGWLGYWMNSSAYHNQLFQYMTGTKVLSLSKASLADTIIQYPSTDEQLKIVTALEEVQRQIATLESLIAKYESIKKATVKKLMTPTSEWQTTTIENIANVVTGATPSTSVSEYWDNATIPWMSSGEINNRFITCTENRISQLGYDRTSTHLIRPNSVLVALAGQGTTRGKVAINRIELCTNQSLAAITPFRPEDYGFVFWTRRVEPSFNKNTSYTTSR